MSNIISFPQRIRPLEEAGRIGILGLLLQSPSHHGRCVLAERKRRTAQFA